jgi:Uma2 family endonuclease
MTVELRDSRESEMNGTFTANGHPHNLADLIAKLGDIPPHRILIDPPPGKAKEKDVLRLSEKEGRHCELVDGTLVEKAMGVEEGKLEVWLLSFLSQYLADREIGELMTASGSLRLAKGLVRAPDISFFLWEHATTTEEDRKHRIARTFPDLAVEVISRSNTPKEMARKRKEYFKAGTSLVWQVYPKKETVEVYTSPTDFRELKIGQSLDGGSILPGFKLPLKTLFGRPTKESRRRK